MMYTLNASASTGAANAIKPLWPAGSDGTKLRIQNQSGQRLDVLVTLPDASVLTIELPARGDFTDENWVDPTLAVGVRCAAQGASFHAVRIA